MLFAMHIGTYNMIQAIRMDLRSWKWMSKNSRRIKENKLFSAHSGRVLIKNQNLQRIVKAEKVNESKER